ncbi:hypothetical protein ACFL6C_06730 [Myxococcota bacterium]
MRVRGAALCDNGRLRVSGQCGVEAMFYWSDRTERLESSTETAKLSVWTLPLLVRASYQIPVEPVAIYGGVAGGIAIIGRSINSTSTERFETQEVQLALSGLVGADMGLGPGRAAIELAYMYTGSEETPVRGSLGGLMLTGGYRLEF